MTDVRRIDVCADRHRQEGNTLVAVPQPVPQEVREPVLPRVVDVHVEVSTVLGGRQRPEAQLLSGVGLDAEQQVEELRDGLGHLGDVGIPPDGERAPRLDREAAGPVDDVGSELEPEIVGGRRGSGAVRLLIELVMLERRFVLG